MSKWIRNKKIKTLWKIASIGLFKSASLENLKDLFFESLNMHSGTEDKQLTDMINESKSVEDLYHILNDMVAEDMGIVSQKSDEVQREITLMCKELEESLLDGADPSIINSLISDLVSATELDHIEYIEKEIEEKLFKTEPPAKARVVDTKQKDYSPRGHYNHCNQIINFGNKGWGSLKDQDYLSYIGCLILDDPIAEKDSFLFNLSDVYSLDKVKKYSGTVYFPGELNDSDKAIANKKYKTLSDPMKRKLDSIIDPENKFKFN